MKNNYQLSTDMIFNYKKLLVDYLHRLAVTPKRIAWLYACIAVIKKIHNELIVFAAEQEKTLTLKPQVIIVEKYLRQQYHDAIYLTENLAQRSVTVHIPTRARLRQQDITEFVKAHAHIGTQVNIREFYL